MDKARCTRLTNIEDTPKNAADSPQWTTGASGDVTENRERVARMRGERGEEK
jgi:hypothetical protein